MPVTLAHWADGRSGFSPWCSWWSAAPGWRWSACASWAARAAAAGGAAGPRQAAPQAQPCSPAGSAASAWGLGAGGPGRTHRPPRACPCRARKTSASGHRRGWPFPHFLRLSSVLLMRNKVFSDKTPQPKLVKNWVSWELSKQMWWRISCLPLF